MGFKKITKPRRSGGSPIPRITIGSSPANGQSYIALNKALRTQLGDPVAVQLHWDDIDALLMLEVTSADNPDAFRIAKASGRISVTPIIRMLRLDATEPRVFEVRMSGRFAAIADLADVPTTGKIRQVRQLKAAS